MMMLGAKGTLPPTNATDCFIAVQFSQSLLHHDINFKWRFTYEFT